MKTTIDTTTIGENSLRKYLRDINNFPECSKKQEQIKLIEKYHNGSKEAFETLYTSNLRLVVHIAKKYSSREEDLKDFICVGNSGLKKGLERFSLEKSKGAKPTSYASWWIKKEIIKESNLRKQNVRLPPNLKKNIQC